MAISWPAAAQSKGQSGKAVSARDKALDLFKQSEDAYREGQFDQAARLLEEAYELHPEPVLLYNLARAYEGMGENEKALDAYKRFLQGSPDAKDRKAIERRIETLENQIAEQNRSEAERKRLEEERRREPDAEQPDEQVPAPTPKPRSKQAGIWPWVTAGVGVGVIGVGAIYGLSAQSKRDDADQDEVHKSSAETFREAESMATTANVLFVVGGLITAGGVTWIVLTRDSETHSSALRLGVGPDRVKLEGRW